jgi:hypothetical protein
MRPIVASFDDHIVPGNAQQISRRYRRSAHPICINNILPTAPLAGLEIVIRDNQIER